MKPRFGVAARPALLVGVATATFFLVGAEGSGASSVSPIWRQFLTRVRRAMAAITANEVFTDVDEIAHSGDLLKERQTRAEMRIIEIEADLDKGRLLPGVAEKIGGDLQRKL